jgi:AcrR family transcriptional regulator
VSETTTRRLLRRDERQAQILTAAATAFARGGYAATSMEDVAAEAGITRLIVYRHFESKEALYAAVLSRVTERLAEEWSESAARRDHGYAFRTILTVAREQPDGFRLLFEYAVREPQFRTFAEDVHSVQVALADEILGENVADPAFRRWATRTVVGYLDDSVLAWLEVGDPERDEEFVQRATDGLVAMFGSWTESLEPVRSPSA